MKSKPAEGVPVLPGITKALPACLTSLPVPKLIGAPVPSRNHAETCPRARVLEDQIANAVAVHIRGSESDSKVYRAITETHEGTLVCHRSEVFRLKPAGVPPG